MTEERRQKGIRCLELLPLLLLLLTKLLDYIAFKYLTTNY